MRTSGTATTARTAGGEAARRILRGLQPDQKLLAFLKQKYSRLGNDGLVDELFNVHATRSWCAGSIRRKNAPTPRTVGAVRADLLQAIRDNVAIDRRKELVEEWRNHALNFGIALAKKTYCTLTTPCSEEVMVLTELVLERTS